MNLRDKVILITGGTSGIGEACTELFARSGALVIAASIQDEVGKALAKRLTDDGHACVFQYCNTSDEADVKSAIELAIRKFGRLDAVHANAGILCSKKITDITVEDFHTIINVNLLGPVLVCKHVLPVMERQGKGVICFTTSVAAEIGFPAHAIYGASKAAVVAMMRSLVTDHSPNGVRFVAVSPGTIDTPMLAASCEGWSKSKEAVYAEVARRIPVRRMGQPIDVANAVAFLFGDEASYINGSVIDLDGGTRSLPPW